mmetsp:Transcript_117053/g.331281  ORF Transcript_117053/g.331281 Transcript_117053/m.331281 type:complete len:112 (-) Transcript_117053:154-489(-)
MEKVIASAFSGAVSNLASNEANIKADAGRLVYHWNGTGEALRQPISGPITLPMPADYEEENITSLHSKLGRYVEGNDKLKPIKVHKPYCGIGSMRRRLPEGLPVKKQLPAW